MRAGGEISLKLLQQGQWNWSQSLLLPLPLNFPNTPMFHTVDNYDKWFHPESYG